MFRRIVRAVDDDHFRTVDLPLLVQYAVACAQADEASERLAADGCVIDGKASAWLQVQEKSMRSAAVLATKLRVAPLSRMDRKTAGANTRSDSRPSWEADGDEYEDLIPRPPHGAVLRR
jgi:hypothetical protein